MRPSLALLLLVFSTPVMAQLLLDRAQEPRPKPVVVELESKKTISALNLCLKDAVSLFGAPAVFAPNPDKSYQWLIRSGGRYGSNLRMTQMPNGTHLSLTHFSQPGNDEVTARIRQCL